MLVLRCWIVQQLITSLWFEKKSQVFAKILDDMVLSGVTLNRFTRILPKNIHNIVIQNIYKGGNLNREFHNYLNIRMKSVSPSLETFNLLVDGFCKKGEVYKASHIASPIFTNGINPIPLFPTVSRHICFLMSDLVDFHSWRLHQGLSSGVVWWIV